MLIDFCLIFVPYGHYDEPEILRYAITSICPKGVDVRHKDYRLKDQSRYKSMTLKASEFIRRFLIHVLPKGLHRIRHYGLLANTSRVDNLEHARELLNVSTSHNRSDHRETEHDSTPHQYLCPACGAAMLVIEYFEHTHAPRAPPAIRLVNTS